MRFVHDCDAFHDHQWHVRGSQSAGMFGECRSALPAALHGTLP